MGKDIAVHFSTIMFEAIPFLLLGAIISAIIEVFVSEERLARMIPKGRIKGAFAGVFLGFLVPACDCAVIPVAMRLKKKKVPTNVIVSFMIASPIVNPVVLLSTFFAFMGVNELAIFGMGVSSLFIYRTILGILLALVIGVIVDYLVGDKILKNDGKIECKTCSHTHTECVHDSMKKNTEKGFIAKSKQIMRVAYADFLEILSFMIIGALLASIMQVVINLNDLGAIVKNTYISTAIMMILAFVLSLCSTSDSFIARTFTDSMSQNSILAFILLGPMIDIKNTIILSKVFNKKFVITLMASIFVVVYIAAIIVRI